MTSLVEFLYPAPARRTPGAILRWWEGRRLAFNLIVGSAGAVSLVVLRAGSWLLDPTPGPLPWGAVLAFGVMANACYLLGPATEVLLARLFGPGLLPTGPALFRMGLTFSVGLALFPSLLVAIMVVIHAVLSLLAI